MDAEFPSKRGTSGEQRLSFRHSKFLRISRYTKSKVAQPAQAMLRTDFESLGFKYRIYTELIFARSKVDQRRQSLPHGSSGNGTTVKAGSVSSTSSAEGDKEHRILESMRRI